MLSFASLATLIVAGCACSSNPPASAPIDQPTAAERAEYKSVAIDTDTARCGGVWVSPTQIVTAFHCVRPEDEVDELLGALGLTITKHQVIGAVVPYHVKADVTVTYQATVVAADEVHDLALLATSSPPVPHGIARVSDRVPRDGEPLDVVGSLAGLQFTYSRCYVAAGRREDGYMQVGGTVYAGDSGGGAFDENGDLVGLAEKIYADQNGIIYGVSFFTPGATVKRFLASIGDGGSLPPALPAK